MENTSDNRQKKQAFKPSNHINIGLPDFATCSILTIEKNVENTAFGLYFFNFML